MGSAVEFNILVVAACGNCHRLRMVVDMFNVEYSWVQLLRLTSWLLLRWELSQTENGS